MKNQSHLVTANTFFRQKNYEGALSEYRKFAKKYPALARIIQANILLCNARMKADNMQIGMNKRRPLISVIIPVHNVENYMCQCLDSVLSQTLQNIEVIVVDDGSSDKSAAILDDYSKRDSRIVFIHNSTASGNSGTPRNQALARATGEYVAFVDSDDWIDPTMLESLYSNAKVSGSDIVSSGGFYRETVDAATELVKVTNNEYIPDVIPRETLFFGHHFTIVWYRIYRLEFITRHRIQFAETTTSADAPFAIKALLFANQVTAIPDVFYHYRFDRPESTVYRRKGRGAFELFKSYSGLFENLLSKPEVSNYIPYIVLKTLGDYQYNLRFLAKDLEAEFKASMHAFVSKYADSHKDHPAFNKYWRGVLDSLLQPYNYPVSTPSQESTDRNSPAISVIIPAYNVEKYIERALTSVLSQSLADIEIIVINDGSTDRSLSIIETVANRDARVIVVSLNKASGSPGIPRNIGICKAKGKYIGFVDADDWVEPNMFKELVEAAKITSSDITSASAFFRHEGEEIKEFKIGYKTINSEIQNNKDAFFSGFFSNIWNRIYLKDLIKLNGIYFPKIYLAEDFCFSAACHALATRTEVVSGTFYHYDYSRPDSTTDLRTGEKGFTIINDFQKMVDYFESFGLYDKFAREIIKKKINSLWYTYERLHCDLKPRFLQDCQKLLLSLREKFDSAVFSTEDLERFSLNAK